MASDDEQGSGVFFFITTETAEEKKWKGREKRRGKKEEKKTGEVSKRDFKLIILLPYVNTFEFPLLQTRPVLFRHKTKIYLQH